MQDVSSRMITKQLEKIGFQLVRTNGSHMIYKKGTQTVPVTQGKTNGAVWLRIQKEIGIWRERNDYR